MKRTLLTCFAGFTILALLSACGGSDNKKNTGVINPTQVGTNVSPGFDPNQNTLLNGGQGLQTESLPCQPTNGIVTNSACINSQQLTPQQLQVQYQDATAACQNPQAVMGYYQNVNTLYSQCNQMIQQPYTQYQPNIYQMYQPQTQQYNQMWGPYQSQLYLDPYSYGSYGGYY